MTAGGNWNEPSAWEVVKKDLRRLKWLDERVLELALDRQAQAVFVTCQLPYGREVIFGARRPLESRYSIMSTASVLCH